MQDKDSQKNLLLAIVLSVSVLLAWQLLFAGPKLKEEQERRARSQQEQTQTSQPGGAPKTGSETLPGHCPSKSGSLLPSSDGDAGSLPRGSPAGQARACRSARRACAARSP